MNHHEHYFTSCSVFIKLDKTKRALKKPRSYDKVKLFDELETNTHTLDSDTGIRDKILRLVL